ncbi:hypothetical protein CPB85DRAFT_1295432 [Mucidula mucida]|nr:hypothetical protein CPB85DRAFT_1295432 [Mucidula mucida]
MVPVFVPMSIVLKANPGSVVTADQTAVPLWLQKGYLEYGGSQLAQEKNGKIKDWDCVKPTAHIFYGTRMLDIDAYFSYRRVSRSTRQMGRVREQV